MSDTVRIKFSHLAHHASAHRASRITLHASSFITLSEKSVG